MMQGYFASDPLYFTQNAKVIPFGQVSGAIQQNRSGSAQYISLVTSSA